jgi:hypothetical protein
MPFFQPGKDDPVPQAPPKRAGLVEIDPRSGVSIDGRQFPWNLIAVDIQNAATRPVLILTLECEDLQIHPRKRASHAEEQDAEAPDLR